jgi:hypothetical protein
VPATPLTSGAGFSRSSHAVPALNASGLVSLHSRIEHRVNPNRINRISTLYQFLI